MQKNTIIKLILLNGIIAFANILLYSNAFLGISIFSGNMLATAACITEVIMSVAAIGYGNYRILFVKPQSTPLKQLITENDYIKVIEQYSDKETFSEKLQLTLKQIKKFEKKQASINDILLQKFTQTEMSFQSFNGAVLNIEKVFYLNIKSMLNRINSFDEEEYLELRKTKNMDNFASSKMKIFQEYIDFVINATNDNEEIILKLDKLLLEISKFNSLDDGEIKDMDAMKEIDELINNVKWYK